MLSIFSLFPKHFLCLELLHRVEKLPDRFDSTSRTSNFFGFKQIIKTSLKKKKKKTVFIETVHSNAQIQCLKTLSESSWCWQWSKITKREKKTKKNKNCSIHARPSLKSYITDIKRQTNFPPKSCGHEKRFLHWNV